RLLRGAGKTFAVGWQDEDAGLGNPGLYVCMPLPFDKSIRSQVHQRPPAETARIAVDVAHDDKTGRREVSAQLLRCRNKFGDALFIQHSTNEQEGDRVEDRWGSGPLTKINADGPHDL